MMKKIKNQRSKIKMKEKNAKIDKSLRARFVILSLSKDGVSLIIAIIFVSAFMLVMAGLFEARLRVIQAIGNREQEAKARYLAESAAELASYAAATHGAGWNLAEGGDATLEGYIWEAARNLGISSCGVAVPGAATQMTPCSRVQVIGRAADTETLSLSGSTYSSVPMKGTGNAGTCDAAHPDANADSACNWNRLYVGQTVEIPLYYVAYDPTTGAENVQKLDNTGDFKLRIRAHGGEELFPLTTDGDNYRHIEKDPVLVQWTISGTSTEPGGQVVGRTLVAMDRKEGQLRLDENESDENTEISGGRINAAQVAPDLHDLIVLEKAHQGIDISSGGSHIQGQPISTFLHADNNLVLYPVFRLSLVGQPRRNSLASGDIFEPEDDVNDTHFDIPYLEYQLLTDVGHPVADGKQVVIGWAEFGGFRKEVRREIQREPTLGGFVLEQF